MAPRRRRNEEDADAGGGGEQRRTLASRSTTEYDTKRKTLVPEDKDEEGLWRPRRRMEYGAGTAEEEENGGER